MAIDRRQDVISLKARLVERWVARRLGQIGHERRVARIASSLIDVTTPHHSLTLAETRLLQLATTVHDVGRAIDNDKHPEIGAAMLLKDTWLPISDFERRALAYLTLYHRGSVPDVGSDEILVDSDPRRTLRTLLGFLRAADALDSRSIESPQLVFAMKARRLQVDCYLNEGSAKAEKVYSRRKKFRLLEDVLGVSVDVDIRNAKALLMVA